MLRTAWRTVLAAGLLSAIGLLPWHSRTDPVLTVLKARSAERDPDPEVLAVIRGELGLDAGPVRLLGRWFGGLLHGGAGRSWISRGEVAPAVGQALGASLLLMAVALAVALLTAAVVCGRTLRLGAARRLVRRRSGSGAAMLAALPEFLTASLLATVVGVQLGWLPALGWYGLPALGWYGPQWLVLPALALGLPAGALLGRMLDDALVGAFAEPWATASAARGIPARRIVRHALHQPPAPRASCAHCCSLRCCSVPSRWASCAIR